MTNFELLAQEVQAGVEGRNSGIPMGFDRLNRYIGIRRGIYTLIGGLTGSGKTALVDDAFVLNPYDWYLENKDKTNIKLHIIYRSMERKKTYKLAKWICRKVFVDHGVIIPIAKLLGWLNKNDPANKLTKDEHDLFLHYKPYIDEMEGIIEIIDGPENPIGIAKHIKEWAMKNGTIEEIDEYKKIYIPNDPNLITIIVLDHIGLVKVTKDHPKKKDAIEKLSDELRYARDFYNFSPVPLSQFNRSIANPIRIKNGDVEPQLEDFKESGSTQEDADVVLALFDPMRYNVEDPSGYDLSKLRDQFGAKYYRSLRLIKNSYGEDDIRIGLGFLGSIGMFKELPKQRDITDSIYDSVLDKSFFLR